MLSQLLLPILSTRYSDRGLVAGESPNPCATFPGIHEGIRQVAIYEDGDELILCIDDLTHSHIADYTDGLSEAERAVRVVGLLVEFLDALFADQIVVWGQHAVGGGWYRRDLREAGRGETEYVWSGPRT